MASKTDLKKRRALIAGVSGGLGLAFARSLLADNRYERVVGIDILEPDHVLADNERFDFVLANLSSNREVEYAVTAAESILNEVELLICCTGRYWSGPVTSCQTAEIKRLV